MQCPYCGADSRVLDSRPGPDQVRRRRECMDCTRRFTTYEKLAESEIVLQKRSGRAEPFDRDKLLSVVERIARGRPHAHSTLRDLVRGLEAELLDVGARTIASSHVAARLHQRLQALDPVLARRFAADYTDERGILRFDDDLPSPQLDLLEAMTPPPLAPTPAPKAPDAAANRRSGEPATPARRARQPRRAPR